MQLCTQNISGEQKLSHETQAFSISTLNTSQSEESIFQRIASCYLFSVFADRSREESQEMLKRLFKGNASDFEMNMEESYDPLILPLNPVEIEQYRALVNSVPFCPINWTLAEVLEFHIHKALSFFKNEGKISSKVIDQFCRNLSGAGLDRCAVFTSLRVSYRQFAEQLEQIIGILESSVTCNKKNRKKYELPYQNALNSLKLLIKIYDLRNPNGQLLRMQRCKAIIQLKDDLPHRKKTPQETYQNLLDYIDFAESLLNHMVGLQKQVKDKSIDQLHRVKAFLQAEDDKNLFDLANVALEEQENPALSLAFNAKEMQKQVLDIYREVKAYRERKQTVLGVHQPDSNVLKVLITDSNHHCMRIEIVAFQQYETVVHLFEKILSLLDIYLGESIQEHASIFTRIVRALASKTIVFNQVSRLEKLQPIFASLIDPRFALSTAEGRALYSSQMTDKIAKKLQTHAMHFLSPEEKGLFIQQCGNFITHLWQIFYPKAEFIEHIYQVEQQEGGWIQPDPSLIVKDAALYPLVSQFLEELYAKLQKLYKIHTDSFIKLISSLTQETCQKHAAALRLFFEELVFEEMMPFCMLYLLHQELHFLTQPNTLKEHASLLETPIGQYLIMKELEYAFYKILPEEIEQTVTEKPITEEEDSYTLHIQPPTVEKTPAQDLAKTSCLPKKAAPIAPSPWAPMKIPEPVQAAKPTLEEKLANLPTNFLRYIQNKERKLMKALKENLGVITLLRQTGSHATLSIGGRKITMTLKGGGSSKSHTVIRGVTRQCFKEK